MKYEAQTAGGTGEAVYILDRDGNPIILTIPNDPDAEEDADNVDYD